MSRADVIVIGTEVYPQSFWLQINVLFLVLTWLLTQLFPNTEPDQHSHLASKRSQLRTLPCT